MGDVTVDQMRVTHIGGPTVLIEVGGWRVLTDPTFDPPGRRYAFGWGSSSRKTAGPALSVEALPPIDLVLLSHDQHADNLDDTGRTVLPRARHVITTPAGARRLGGSTIGLAPWQELEITGTGKPPLRITGTPCRHGPPLLHRLSGDVTGFALAWDGQRHGAVWISGDTVLFPDVMHVPERLTVGTLLLHLGGVHFGVTGPFRYTLRSRETAAFVQMSRARAVIPIHYEGWSHFEGEAAHTDALRGLPPEVQRLMRPVPLGVATDIAV